MFGNGLRYREMIVIPLENCSAGRSAGTDWNGAQAGSLTDILPRGIKRIKVVEVGQGTGRRLVRVRMAAGMTRYLKNFVVPPRLYPITRRFSLLPSTSNTSITGP